jgi:hypothetical protein
MVSTTHNASLAPTSAMNVARPQHGIAWRAFAVVLGALLWLPKKLVVSYGEYLLMHYSWGGPVCTTRHK